MSYGFLSTSAALQLIASKITAIQYNGGPCFSKVALFDMTNLATALTELFSYGNRVCFIAHDTENFMNKKEGRVLHCRQTRDIHLLISDRQIANRQFALFGDPNSVNTPGAFALKDLVLNNILGLIQPGMYIEPVSGEQMILEKKTREELQGRAAFTLSLRLIGGNVDIDLGQQPIP
jgi:hypothetical protein